MTMVCVARKVGTTEERRKERNCCCREITGPEITKPKTAWVRVSLKLLGLGLNKNKFYYFDK